MIGRERMGWTAGKEVIPHLPKMNSLRSTMLPLYPDQIKRRTTLDVLKPIYPVPNRTTRHIHKLALRVRWNGKRKQNTIETLRAGA